MRRPLRWLPFVALLAATMSYAQGQSSTPGPIPKGEGAISGTVVDGSTSAPVADAIVSINGGTFASDYQRRQLTDAKGRFAFAHLADSDNYTIAVAKLGFLDGGFGRDTSPADALRTIAISHDAWVGNVKAVIWRPGSLSGVVRDESGEPVVGVIVRALARLRLGGREVLAAGPIAMTDDHGAYRIAGLLAGRYIIQVPSVQMSVPMNASVSLARGNAPSGVLDIDDTARLAVGGYPLPPPRVDGRAMSYGPSFHPAETNVAQAVAVDLAFADDHVGVDVALTPVATTRVSGVVDGPPEALANLTLRLLPAGLEDLGLGAEVATALAGKDGTFTFVNVPAGAYTIDAPMTFNELTVPSGASTSGGSVGFGSSVSLPPLPTASSSGWSGIQIEGIPGGSFRAGDSRNGNYPKYFGRASVTVGGAPLSGVTLRLRPAATMRGRIVIEADPNKPASPLLPRFFTMLDPAGGQARLGMPFASGSVTAGMEFEIPGIQSGEYWLRSVNEGWVMKSVQWHGREYLTSPIDTSASEDLSGVVVTVTTAMPVLTGSVRQQDGTPPEVGMVVAFPVDPAMRLNAGLSPIWLKSAAIMQNGAYRLTSLPAGDFFVAAIDRAHISTWRDPAYLATLERQASRVTLAWGRTTNQDLTVVASR